MIVTAAPQVAASLLSAVYHIPALDSIHFARIFKVRASHLPAAPLPCESQFYEVIPMNQALTYIFVHGLSGWGSYDSRYRSMPYWGMRGGDLMAYLKSRGYACYAASVSPTGSAWDRACELYAQMAGPRTDGRDPRDYADYDMEIDHALALNRRIGTEPDVCYYAVPCGFTEAQPDGTHRPKRGMEPLFVMRSCQIGAYRGKTPEGFPLDESWRENDGLVNTISSKAPFGAPSKDLDRTSVTPGIWNVLPTYPGDHMALQGGLSRRHDVRGFYLELLGFIEAASKLKHLPRAEENRAWEKLRSNGLSGGCGALSLT